MDGSYDHDRQDRGFDHDFKRGACTCGLDHAKTCVQAIEAHCGGDPAKVGQMRSALEEVLEDETCSDERTISRTLEAKIRLALAPQETEP